MPPAPPFLCTSRVELLELECFPNNVSNIVNSNDIRCAVNGFLPASTEFSVFLHVVIIYLLTRSVEDVGAANSPLGGSCLFHLYVEL